MIYLMPEVETLGDDTFWIWAKREFPNSKLAVPTSMTKDDVLLRYSVKRFPLFGEHTIGLLWEQYPEMKAMLGSDAWDSQIAAIDECGYSCAKLTATSSLVVPYYEKYNKPIDIMPIAVDTDVFQPYDKVAMRAKYNIPQNKRVGFWSGSLHPMKAFDRVQQYAMQNKDIYWIIVWRWPQEPGFLPGALNRLFMPQQELAELMSCADFFYSCSRLRPYYMVEWESMACNLPFIGNFHEKDFVPSENTRDDVFKHGWDRKSAKTTWLNYINDFIRSKQ